MVEDWQRLSMLSMQAARRDYWLQVIALTLIAAVVLLLLYLAASATNGHLKWLWVLFPAPALGIWARHVILVFIHDHWSDEDNYP